MRKFILLAVMVLPVAANAGIIKTAYKGTKAVVKTTSKGVTKAGKIVYKVVY